MFRICLFVVFLIGTFAPSLVLADSPTSQPATVPAPVEGLARLRQEAAAVRPLIETPLAKLFLDRGSELPTIASRSIYRTSDRKYLTTAARNALAESERVALTEATVSESVYYTTKYGTPLAYVRVVELLGKHGVESLEGKRVLDFGYGSVGHLRLMASAGAETVGVDVDSLLTALYSESGDTGRIENPSGKAGTIRLIDGEFPKDDAIRRAVGAGYDIFTSKNTLKKGYVHPAEEVDPRMTLQLGVSDEEYVRALQGILKPGGLALIYNICPAPAKEGEAYIPWADGRCPFAREVWEANGFEIIAFDVDDSEFVRKMAHAFEWDAPPGNMDLEKDLFATCTIARKKH